MRKIQSGFALTLLLLGSLTAACGSDDDDGNGGGNNGVTFSCMFPNNDGCQELVGATGQALDAVQNACTQQGGTAGTGCSRDGVSGVCTFQVGGAASRIYYYGLDADGVAPVRQVCENSTGVWSTS